MSGARQTPIVYLNTTMTNTNSSVSGLSTTTGRQFVNYASSIQSSNVQINNTLTVQPTTAQSANFYSTSLNLFGNITLYGTVSNRGDTTTYLADKSSTAAEYPNAATVNFSNFSGMIIVNNTGLTGVVQLWLCGSGAASAIGSSSGTSNGVGTITYNSGIGGYTWSNNSGTSQAITFAVIRTRAEG